MDIAVKMILAILMDEMGETYVRLVPESKKINQIMYVKDGSWIQTWIIKKFSFRYTKKILRNDPFIPEAISPGVFKKIRNVRKE